MRSVFRAQLVQQALEVLERLGTFDRVALIENKQRHATDAALSGQTLGGALLAPTRLYARHVRAMLDAVDVPAHLRPT